MLPIQGCVKNYHWGKVGNDNYIARFLATQTKDSTTPQANDKPLAELWFGSHPSGPALIRVDKQYIKLDAFLDKEPSMVGTVDHYRKYNKKLSFLFKILSVEQSLSLQAHPDKKLAEILHLRDPKNYPDSNHKPELAIALTQFEVLCDFRPPREILQFMKALSSFRRLIGGDKNYEQYCKLVDQEQQNSEAQRAILAQCFKSLMTSDRESIVKETRMLLTESANLNDKHLLTLINQLDKLYPGDPGIFAPFFLNYIKLEPGQAIYLKSNKLHAYIKGECIECMACSDNVVRAGLTTKYRDLETLIDMLNYETVTKTSDILLPGSRDKNNASIISYAPTEEFKVDKIDITSESTPNREYTLPSLSSGSFIVVMSGKATAKDFLDPKVQHIITLGAAAFIPPKIAVRLHNIQTPMIIYRAYS